MEQIYWIDRKRSAIEMARAASTTETRLIHYVLAGRYSINAAYCAPMPAPARPRVGTGERAAFNRPRPEVGLPASATGDGTSVVEPARLAGPSHPKLYNR